MIEHRKCCKHFCVFRTVSEYCSAEYVFPVLVFQQSKQQNRTRTTPLNRTRNPSEPYSDKETPLRRALRRFAFLVGFSTGNPPKWDFHRSEPYTKPYSDTVRVLAIKTCWIFSGFVPQPSKLDFQGSGRLVFSWCWFVASTSRCYREQR